MPGLPLPHRPRAEDARPPRLRLISDYARHWAEQAPEREAVVSGETRWRYPELARRVDQAARALIAAGVAPGDRVAALTPPHPDFMVSFLATASIGGIWLGLNPRYQRGELEYAVTDAEPRIVLARAAIGDRRYDDDLEALRQACPTIERVVALGGDAPPVAGGESYADFVARGAAVDDAALAGRRGRVGSGDPCLIVYTSGTTGRPKGAMISHHGLIHVARVQHAIWPVDPLRIINNLPVNHIGCVGDITCDTLVPGGTLVFQEQFDPGGMLELVEREEITMFGHVPTALQLIVSHPRFETTDFSGVQLIIWEGAAAPVGLIERLRAKCPSLANAYGMTETVGSVTFTFDATETDLLANSVGWPVPEYGVRLADAAGTPAADGQPGEVQVRGDFVTLGYWRRPEATDELFTPDGWLRTGDLAVTRPDGAIRLIGRLKEMFKSGGYNVYPREVEQALETHPGVAMAAVIGIPDPLYAEVGHAFVIAEPGQDPAPAELEAHCRARLANYKVPKRFTVARELPMLPIGKIDKQALKRMAP
jgi:acyl-CoA synthetase (AMP-forming)/AMP-acid ligase II